MIAISRRRILGMGNFHQVQCPVNIRILGIRRRKRCQPLLVQSPAFVLVLGALFFCVWCFG